MRTEDIFALGLGLTPPWQVLSQRLDTEKAPHELHLVLGADRGAILLSMAGSAHDFKNGREFAAYLGLVPRQHSTGGKQRMLGITKRGDTYVRTLLIHGARAVLCSMKKGGIPLGEGGQTIWLAQLCERRGINRASVALANKTARVVWSMIAHATEYRVAA
jgi:transposase